MEGPVFEFRQGQDISPLQNVQNGSEVHSQWVRRPESGDGHTPPPTTEAINVWSCNYISPICFHVVENDNSNFDVLLTVHLSIFISVFNQPDAQNFCFKISLFHASTCFEHMCSSSSGGKNCITQPLVSSNFAHQVG